MVDRAQDDLGETMSGMIALLVAIIGSGALGVLISDWLRRKDSRASVAADLKVWAKLPEGDARAQLLANIEHRLQIMLMPPHQSLLDARKALSSVAFSLLGLVFILVSQIVTGYIRFEHHPDGLLWVHLVRPPESYSTFDDWVMRCVTAPGVTALFVVLATVGFMAWDREREGKTSRKQAQKSSMEDSPPVHVADSGGPSNAEA